MKDIRKILIILVIAILIVIGAMLIIGILNEDEEQSNNIALNNSVYNSVGTNVLNNNQTTGGQIGDNTEIKLEKVTNRNIFFSVEGMISKYFLYLRVGNAQAVLQLLEEELVAQNSINTENVLELTRANIPYDGTYKAREMYSIYTSDRTIYYVYGTLEKNAQKTSYYITMYYDSKNTAYAIKPITAEEYTYYTSDSIKESNDKIVQQNPYNKITSTSVTDEDLANKYLRDYVQNARYNPEEAYNSLDEEYKAARFGSYNEYLAYLRESNKAAQLESLDPSSIRDREEFSSDDEYALYLSSITQKSLEKYQIYTENGQQYCICLDPYGNYYIFEIDGVMNYKLYLDTYTVDINYFTSKFEDATDSTKTQLNIERIFEAINNKDYLYVYNKLADNDTFANYQTMVNYIENNFYENNEIDVSNYLSNDEITSYSVTVTDGNVTNSDEIVIKIEMELGEGQEYKIRSMEIQNEEE